VYIHFFTYSFLGYIKSAMSGTSFICYFCDIFHCPSHHA